MVIIISIDIEEYYLQMISIDGIDLFQEIDSIQDHITVRHITDLMQHHQDQITVATCIDLTHQTTIMVVV
jgi:hypothetical protein